MAERQIGAGIVSPGVFTNEIDQSFLPGAIAQIGAAIVGPTIKGPALVPTQITSYGQFTAQFGSFTDDSYVPYVVQDYLRNGNVITVTRLLYEDGYYLTNGGLAVVAQSGSTKVVTHVLHPVQAVTTTGATNVFEDSVIASSTSGSFAITVSSSELKLAMLLSTTFSMLEELSLLSISSTLVGSETKSSSSSLNVFFAILGKFNEM